jgi:hypothetical protein
MLDTFDVTFAELIPGRETELRPGPSSAESGAN